MNTTYYQSAIHGNTIFSHHYIDSKALFVYCFQSIPSLSVLRHIDGEKGFNAFKQKYGSLIRSVHCYREVTRKDKTVPFDETQVVLHNGFVLEFDNDYCQILHDQEALAFVCELIDFLKAFRERRRKKHLEINLIARNGSDFELKAMEIKRTRLNLELFYEDDFIPVDELIRKRLNNDNDKGIVLLHGLPGAGKTTYLRHLIGKIKKRVLLLSPNIAASLADPQFVNLMTDYPNSVLIIEDAENIIMDRNNSSNSPVSNLLNISDGLLSDFMNLQLICTFNSALTMIDSALLRKGRLIAKYEFGRLSVRKAKRLSAHFGFDTEIDSPMTVAEVANQHEKEHKVVRNEVIGFRKSFIEN